jgi:hypothetical protein
MDDTITTLLRKVASGKVSVEDARVALEDASLTEDQMQSAIDHGVFNLAESGTIVNASLAPSGASNLIMIFFVWGLFWSFYWVFSMIYGLAQGWDQQQLSYHLGMMLITLCLMGMAYLKFVLPDTIIVKHGMNKFVPEHPKDWKEYKW